MDEGRDKKGRNKKVVGFIKQRELLRNYVKQLMMGGNGGVIMIEGEAGSGKTVLMNEVETFAQSKMLKTYFGNGDALERNTSYFMWRRVLFCLFELHGLADLDARRTRVQTMLTDVPEMLNIAPLLNTVLPLDIPENETTMTMSKEVRGMCTRQLLLSLLKEMVARTPKVC